MAVSFELKFTYDINYNLGDTLYFGMNLLLGCREFPLRFAGSATSTSGSSIDNSPRSSRTFNFTAGAQDITFNESNIFNKAGLEDVTKVMLYTDPSNPIAETFKTGSVALRQIVEFNPANGGSLNDFFDKQFTEVSDISLTVKIDTLATTLVGKPTSVKLGKQFGEILLLSWSSAAA